MAQVRTYQAEKTSYDPDKYPRQSIGTIKPINNDSQSKQRLGSIHPNGTSLQIMGLAIISFLLDDTTSNIQQGYGATEFMMAGMCQSKFCTQNNSIGHAGPPKYTHYD